MQMTPAVCFEKASKTIGDIFGRKTILSDITFEIQSGSVCGLVGHNGAGKSTLLSLAVGLQEPTSGQVRVKGCSPKLPEARRGLGYAHEQPALPATLTAREVLQYRLELLGLGTESVDSLLDTVQLKDDSRRVSAFSKGMRQRLTIAMSLAGDPDLLILDEPMSGLDPIGRTLIRDIIFNQKNKGKTIIFSSHILSDIAILCNKILVLRDGILVLDETIESGGQSTWCIQLRDDDTSWTRNIEGIVGIKKTSVFVTHEKVWDVCSIAANSGASILSVVPQALDLENRVLPLLVHHHE